MNASKADKLPPLHASLVTHCVCDVAPYHGMRELVNKHTVIIEQLPQLLADADGTLWIVAPPW
jgi:hypothetical protein